MATHTLTNVRVLVDEYDFSCSLNQGELGIDVEPKDVTTFCQGTRTMRAGLRVNALSLHGFVDFSEITTDADDSVDEYFFTAVGREDALVTVAPDGVDAGDVAYTGLWEFAEYSPGAQVGDLLEFDVAAGGRSQLTRVTSMFDALDSQSASFTADKVQLGAVPAGSRLVAVLHVTAFDGNTLDVAVRSDADSSAGSETTRGSFTQLTGVGSERIVVAAPVTDTYWDVDLTFDGTSFTAYVGLGIETIP